MSSVERSCVVLFKNYQDGVRAFAIYLGCVEASASSLSSARIGRAKLLTLGTKPSNLSKA